jgi:hypothetical protein
VTQSRGIGGNIPPNRPAQISYKSMNCLQKLGARIKSKIYRMGILLLFINRRQLEPVHIVTCQHVARQRDGKQVSAKTDSW